MKLIYCQVLNIENLIKRVILHPNGEVTFALIEIPANNLRFKNPVKLQEYKALFFILKGDEKK